MATKAVDVFNIFDKTANLRPWIYIVLKETVKVWPVKLLKQRAFASVDILQLKCVRSKKLNLIIMRIFVISRLNSVLVKLVKCQWQVLNKRWSSTERRALENIIFKNIINSSIRAYVSCAMLLNSYNTWSDYHYLRRQRPKRCWTLLRDTPIIVTDYDAAVYKV